jgi:hypothetical protein
VYHSLSFNHTHFARKLTSIDAIFEEVLTGGYTKSNAGFVGRMFGVINWRGIFWLANVAL